MLTELSDRLEVSELAVFNTRNNYLRLKDAQKSLSTGIRSVIPETLSILATQTRPFRLLRSPKHANIAAALWVCLGLERRRTSVSRLESIASELNAPEEAQGVKRAPRKSSYSQTLFFLVSIARRI